ncbi:DsbA family protein [Gordonia aquimaris]|jgi:protein-disulfide isomerase|uniref:Thioredoxin domain-containing protein n=1 Tax=Gordonia aquimaris TaxID=2984863 RepID=A0A9X3D7G3_9ACTN|nr:thioredoxin domain-containing protein [Gordonia aquimaris]MCX2966483.1 thioredoxin domain-containing protein [Gordonia aquimaris]
MNTSRPTKIAWSIVAAILLAIGVAMLLDREDTPTPTDTALVSDLVVRPDSHRLTSPPQSKATFVEFLDFECEACGALYPIIEDMRRTYGDRVTFVVRYFPMPGHFNAERAARAVEAAAQQGRFEQMYQHMFTTQAQWGEQRTPADDLFRSFAVDLGLDMTAFDVVYDSPATLARIRADVADGLALGVQGTPTFFLDDQRLEPTSIDDLTDALNQATN